MHLRAIRFILFFFLSTRTFPGDSAGGRLHIKPSPDNKFVPYKLRAYMKALYVTCGMLTHSIYNVQYLNLMSYYFGIAKSRGVFDL